MTSLPLSSQSSQALPLGWQRSKRGSLYLRKSGFTLLVYPGPQGGLVWRIAPWRGHGFVDAPTPLATAFEACEAAEGALPSARVQIAATQSAQPPRWPWRQEG
jgi:hypothetical protein